MTTKQDRIVEAIEATLISPNVPDSNLESANVVDVLNDLSNNTWKIANAITPFDVLPGNDSTGGVICSLTEAVMGVTSGLMAIANAIKAH